MRSLIRWNPRNEVTVNDPFETLEQMVEEQGTRGRSPTRVAPGTAARLLRPAMDVVENDKVTPVSTCRA